MLLLQYIETIPVKMDQDLLQYYNENTYKYNFECIEMFISSHINELIEKANGSVKSVYQDVRKDWRRKKQRWLSTAKNDFDKNITKKNTFSVLYENKLNLTDAEWCKLYNTRNIDDVKKEYLDQISEWADDNDKYLYEFPLFHSFTAASKEKAIIRDIEYNIMKIILKELGDDVNNCIKIKPEILTETPLFTDKKQKITMETSGNGEYKFLLNTLENGCELSITATSQTDETFHIMKMLDSKDAEIINYIFNHVEQDFYKSGVIHLSVANLTRYLYPRANSRRYDEVKDRILNMVGKTITYKNNKGTLIFTLLDSAFMHEDNEDKISVYLGAVMRDAYITNKVVYITKIAYDLLENEISKHLCYALQRERIKLSTPDPENDAPQEVYDYEFFLQPIMFKSHNKNKNIALIKESLEEFKQKKIIVKDFVVAQERFYITYYPLTENERADLENIRRIPENKNYLFV